MVAVNGGIAFIAFYYIFVAALIILLTKSPVAKSVDEFMTGAGSMASLYFILIFVDTLANFVTKMGGFEALGKFCFDFFRSG